MTMGFDGVSSRFRPGTAATRVERTLGLAWICLLGLAGGLSAQAPAEVTRFKVLRRITSFGNMFPPGEMTITNATVRFEAHDLIKQSYDPKHSLDMPIQDITHVTGHTKLQWVTIRLKSGKSYLFLAGSQVEAIVEAIGVAMTGNLGPLPLPAVRAFAPIPAPLAPADAPAGPGGVVLGQTQDQVKAILGQPDEIEIAPSSATGGKKTTWSYKNLTVTFVDGKVSAVDQGSRPSGPNTVR